MLLLDPLRHGKFRSVSTETAGGADLQVFQISPVELVDQTFGSWNRIGQWLSQLENLRSAVFAA